MVAQMVKNLPATQETQVWSLGWKDSLEKEMAAHSSILAWRILWTEEPDGLQSMGSQRVGHDWATYHSSTHTGSFKFPHTKKRVTGEGGITWKEIRVFLQINRRTLDDVLCWERPCGGCDSGTRLRSKVRTKGRDGGLLKILFQVITLLAAGSKN